MSDSVHARMDNWLKMTHGAISPRMVEALRSFMEEGATLIEQAHLRGLKVAEQAIHNKVAAPVQVASGAGELGMDVQTGNLSGDTTKWLVTPLGVSLLRLQAHDFEGSFFDGDSYAVTVQKFERGGIIHHILIVCGFPDEVYMRSASMDGDYAGADQDRIAEWLEYEKRVIRIALEMRKAVRREDSLTRILDSQEMAPGAGDLALCKWKTLVMYKRAEAAAPEAPSEWRGIHCRMSAHDLIWNWAARYAGDTKGA